VILGDLQVDVLNDGFWRSDGGAMFGVVPRVLWERKLPPDARNRVTMALRCLLIRTAGRTILVDTGIGDKLDARAVETFGVERGDGLLGELARCGVAPERVDVVVDTHLHFDHAGGNTTLRDGRPVPTFPNAEYWVQRSEWEDATHPNERTRTTYLADNLTPIAASGQLRQFDGPVEVAPGVSWLPAPGHTRGHTVVVVQSNGHSLVFPVDVCPFVAHLERLAWVPAVDLEPLVSMATKRRVIADTLAGQRLVVFDHDPQVVTARLAGDPQRWTVEPVTFEGQPPTVVE
jgi:glyoxylase-like metal-dependent hydrolase (beta-lactamase superfamily II)